MAAILGAVLESRLAVSLREKTKNPETQRRMVLIIVCIALLLDNMLYMVIVPIIPVFLGDLDSDANSGPTLRTAIYYRYGDKRLTEKQVVELNLTGYTNLTKEVLEVDFVRNILGWEAQVKQSSNIGLLFASKAIVQLFISPFAGPIIDRMGYERPMIVGLCILFLSTAIFAFGQSYGVLFVARSLQGVGSAFADTAGLAMIADRFKEPSERSKAQGIALAFISFGSLFAPPFGGFLYEFAGKAVPFVVLSFIALADGAMLLFMMKPHLVLSASGSAPKLAFDTLADTSSEKVKLHGTPIYRLILDPYIAICAGALVVANINLAFLEPTIALWMKDTLDAAEWQIGMVWLPAFFPHVLGVYVTVRLMKLFPRKQWLITSVGLILEGASCVLIPFCHNAALIILPLMVDCFGIALVDTAILPTLGYLVDVRHVSVYGSVYAIADVSYSLAYAFGPVIADFIYRKTSFEALNFVIFFASALYCPALLFLRNICKYDNVDGDDGYEPAFDAGGAGGGLMMTSEVKPIAVATAVGQVPPDYRSYMMGGATAGSQTGTGNGSAMPAETRNPFRDGFKAVPQQPEEEDVNRKYVQVGRARSCSRDSSDGGDVGGDYRTYH